MSKPIHVEEIVHYSIKKEAADADTSMKDLSQDLILSAMERRDITLKEKSGNEIPIQELKLTGLEEIDEESI